MQNVAIIGVLVLALIGGFIFFGGSEPEMNDVMMDEEMGMMDEEMNDMVEDDMAATEADIVTTAVNTPTLSTLVAAVTAADLVATLQGPGPFTVFAPTNDAFAALPAGTVETLLEPANIADLQGILTYHVVAGAVMAGDLVDGMEVETVNGDTITINVSDAGVSINGGPSVVMADIVTSNGVVHVIDGVLLPSAE
jgi:uncharacterized surface protein with fasciclin (FAS1) repeats